MAQPYTDHVGTTVGHLDHRYYFNGVDDAIEFCQESPENITGLSGLMCVVMKDKPEEFSKVKL